MSLTGQNAEQHNIIVVPPNYRIFIGLLTEVTHVSNGHHTLRRRQALSVYSQL